MKCSWNLSFTKTKQEETSLTVCKIIVALLGYNYMGPLDLPGIGSMEVDCSLDRNQEDVVGPDVHRSSLDGGLARSGPPLRGVNCKSSLRACVPLFFGISSQEPFHVLPAGGRGGKPGCKLGERLPLPGSIKPITSSNLALTRAWLHSCSQERECPVR